MGIDKQVVFDYINLLSNYAEKDSLKNDMTDDDFLKLRERLKSKKS